MESSSILELHYEFNNSNSSYYALFYQSNTRGIQDEQGLSFVCFQVLQSLTILGFRQPSVPAFAEAGMGV